MYPSFFTTRDIAGKKTQYAPPHHLATPSLLFLLNLCLLPTYPTAYKAAEAWVSAWGYLRNGASGVHNAAVGRPEGGGVHWLIGLCVDTEADPGKHAVVERVTDEGIPHDGVIAVGALHEEEVGRVLGDGHLVGVVWGDFVDVGEQGLVEVELADVGGVTSGDGVIRLLGGAEIDNGVDMCGAAGVVAWQEAVEGRDAVAVGRLDAAKGGPLQYGCVIGVPHAGISLDSNVHALVGVSNLYLSRPSSSMTYSGVAAPDINVGVWNNLAGLVVNHLDG